MAKTSAEGFSQFLTWLTPSETEREKASSHRASIYAKLDDTLGLYRMFESGSFRHGTGVSAYSDVDYFVSLKSSKPTYSSSTLNRVRDVLIERFPTTYIHVARPAVVLDFGGGYERVEVIPAYPKEKQAEGSMKFNIPGVLGEWLESTPEAHSKYVNECNQKPTRGAAKSMTRLIKAWKYNCNVPISSFYLEMRTAQYVAAESSIIYALDMYYFLKRLKEHNLAAMNDPTGNTGRIHPCSSDSKLTEARSKLSTAVGRAEKAMNAHLGDDIAEAFRQWDLLFGGAFPAYY